MIFMLTITLLLNQVGSLSDPGDGTQCLNESLTKFEYPTYIQGIDIIYINRAVEHINNQYQIIINIADYDITVNEFDDVFMVSIYHELKANENYQNNFMYRAVVHFEVDSPDAPLVVFYQTIGDLWGDANVPDAQE